MRALTTTSCSSADLLDRALARATGAPLIGGNHVRILKDAAEHYPAWLAAIRTAERTIFFESYILHEDDCGGEFAEALIARAKAGVGVRLIYDWFGGLGKTSHHFWRRLRAAGVEGRCFNPPRLANPLGWVARDHRKMLAVDGHVGFVTGLCIGRMWLGDPAHGLEPWRDTGVEIRGPAVAEIERAFAQVWSAIGDPLPKGARHAPGAMAAAGDVSLRVVASAPGTTGMLRVDQLIASVAQRTLWLTDAYFAGIHGGSVSRAAAGAVRFGRTVGAALGAERILKPTDAHIVALGGLVLFRLAATVVRWPIVVALPLATVIGWAGVGLLIRAYRLWTAR